MDFEDILAALGAKLPGGLRAGLAARYGVAAGQIVIGNEEILIPVNQSNPSLPQQRAITGEEIQLMLVSA